MCLAYFFDILSRHWQTSGRLVQEYNVCTEDPKMWNWIFCLSSLFLFIHFQLTHYRNCDRICTFIMHPKVCFRRPKKLFVSCKPTIKREKNPTQGLSRYLETGCPNRGFIDCCVSKVWYKIHTTNKIDPIPLQILLFSGQILLCVSYKRDTTASTSSIFWEKSSLANSDINFWVSKLSKNSVLRVQKTRWTHYG